GDAWTGAMHFGSLSGVLIASSQPMTPSTRTSGSRVAMTGSIGTAAVTTDTPLDLWPAGDTGQARSIVARAHPVLDGGRLRVNRLGRLVSFASAEAQYWW